MYRQSSLTLSLNPSMRILRGALGSVLSASGHNVRTSDLYATHFDPSEAGRHFKVRRYHARFDAQAEQRHGWDNRSLADEVRKEVGKIMSASVLILQFPLWWSGPPAILKGWMDRVFVYGGLYTGSRLHDSGFCRGKKALLSVTTGSSEAVLCVRRPRRGDPPYSLAVDVRASVHRLI
jgi:NAD(P)H dehydrogenase (quinone)